MAWTEIGGMITLLLFIVHNSHADCSLGLGMMTGDIQDSQITASSSYSMWTQPSAGRLWNNRRVQDSTFGGWCAVDGDDAPYLQVDLRKETVVTAVATQGLNFPLGNWVEKYTLNYSCDGLNWNTYRSFDKHTALKGNGDGDSVVTNWLDEAIIARVVRINAVEWNTYGIVCMRVEIYGCDTKEDGSYEDCSTAAGLENRQITDNHVTASSFTSGHHPPQGRLNNVFKQVNDTAVWGSWCAGAEDMSQYIQVDLTEVRNISGVATQGAVMGCWVTEYMLNYSMDGAMWERYGNDSGPQVLKGNVDEVTVHKNMFDRQINARYVRFNPRAWTPLGQICMRVEIYLCQTYQGCPCPDRIPSTYRTVTSHQIPSVASDITSATKINTFTRPDEPFANSVRELYSAGLRNTASFTMWILILAGWLFKSNDV